MLRKAIFATWIKENLFNGGSWKHARKYLSFFALASKTGVFFLRSFGILDFSMMLSELLKDDWNFLRCLMKLEKFLLSFGNFLPTCEFSGKFMNSTKNLWISMIVLRNLQEIHVDFFPSNKFISVLKRIKLQKSINLHRKLILTFPLFSYSSKDPIRIPISSPIPWNLE